MANDMVSRFTFCSSPPPIPNATLCKLYPAATHASRIASMVCARPRRVHSVQWGDAVLDADDDASRVASVYTCSLPRPAEVQYVQLQRLTVAHVPIRMMWRMEGSCEMRLASKSTTQTR